MLVSPASSGDFSGSSSSGADFLLDSPLKETNASVSESKKRAFEELHSQVMQTSLDAANTLKDLQTQFRPSQSFSISHYLENVDLPKKLPICNPSKVLEPKPLEDSTLTTQAQPSFKEKQLEAKYKKMKKKYSEERKKNENLMNAYMDLSKSLQIRNLPISVDEQSARPKYEKPLSLKKKTTTFWDEYKWKVKYYLRYINISIISFTNCNFIFKF
jgi:hypothetical protein